jgi:hypothetical protein
LDLFWLFNYLHLFFIKLICGKFKNEIKKNWTTSSKQRTFIFK